MRVNILSISVTLYLVTHALKLFKGASHWGSIWQYLHV